MGLLTTVFLGLLTFIALFLASVHRFLRPVIPVKGKTNVPGPTEGTRWPIIGDALWFYGLKSMKELWSVMQKLSKMRKVMSFYFGSKLVIFISDSKTAEKVISMNKCPDKEIEFYQAFQSVTNGIISRNGKAWSDFRRPLDKIIHIKKMDDMLIVVAEKTKILCGKIASTCDGTVIELDDLVKLCTLDITLENVFGTPGTQQIEDTMKIPYVSKIGLDTCFHRMFKPELKMDWMFKRSHEGRVLQQATAISKVALSKMVTDCYDRLAREGRVATDPDFEPKNFVEVAIRVARLNNDSEDTLIFSFFDLLIAGFDTTSIAISSLILYLAMFPEYQDKIYQEQLDVMKSSLDVPSTEEMARMTFLEMAFNETLRHVSAPSVARTLTEQIEIDGYIYPEGASMIFNLAYMFSDPIHWERPKEFYPEHFLPEKVAKRTRGAFMPFSFGSRGCAGKIYSYLSSKLILSMITRRFKFTTDLKFEEMSYRYSLMRESEKGYPVFATLRVPLEKV